MDRYSQTNRRDLSEDWQGENVTRQIEPDIADFRHLAKHVPIPNVTAQEIGVDTILSWPQDAIVAPDAPRTGRELEVFHLATAFLQKASVNAADCDVHFEISHTADKNAPRVIVETPVDSEFCSARQNAQSQLAKHGFKLDSQHGGELPQALPVRPTIFDEQSRISSVNTLFADL